MHTKEEVAVLSSLAIVALLSLTTVSYATSTTYTNTTQTVTQQNWRSAVTAFGTLSYTIDDSGPYYTYTATGNALHETFTYSPSVTDVSGASHVYTYDKTTGAYLLHSGVVSYTSPYSGLTINEVWSGWISFSGAPISSANLAVTTGQLNQWGFVYDSSGSIGTTVLTFYTNALYMGSGYWLVGFSTYIYGTSPTLDTTFPGGAFWTLAMNPPHLP